MVIDTFVLPTDSASFSAASQPTPQRTMTDNKHPAFLLMDLLLKSPRRIAVLSRSFQVSGAEAVSHDQGGGGGALLVLPAQEEVPRRMDPEAAAQKRTEIPDKSGTLPHLECRIRIKVFADDPGSPLFLLSVPFPRAGAAGHRKG
jgi:hypothetical protein